MTIVQQLFLRAFAVLLLMAAWPVLADPPERVGRISYFSGQVSFRVSKDDQWVPASLNYPVTTHNGFVTENDSRLEIHIGSAAIRLDEDSEISFPQLDDDAIRLNVKRGVVNVSVRAPKSHLPIEVLTPAGKTDLSTPGIYRFEASRDQTIITVFRGTAFLDTDDSQITVREGREIVVRAIEPLEYSLRNARQGPFEDWVHARDARMDHSRSSQYVSSEIAGHEDLDEYGDWQETSEYGAVWVPRITTAEWAPYRTGRWAWVEPWGWTWVDDAPWGFAPFHYGRWVYFNNHWGWTPGAVVARPVYAPALVAFVGRPGWSVSFSSGTAPAVGWVPLGHRDLYHPSYACSPTYVRNINVTNINVRNVNVTGVNWNNLPAPGYSLRKYPHAMTVVPQSAFASGKPVINHATRFTGPVNESVRGTTLPIAPPPARKVVTDIQNHQRPPTFVPRTIPQQIDGRSAGSNTATSARPRTGIVQPKPGRELKAQPAAPISEPSHGIHHQRQEDENKHRIPRIEHALPLRPQPTQETARQAPQPERLNADRPHPSNIPQRMEQRTPHDAGRGAGGHRTE